MNSSAGSAESKQIPLVYRGVMALSGATFLVAAISGIWRIALMRGFLLPSIPHWWPPHGHLMVGGFLAGVIMFERIIALRIRLLSWVPYAYVLSAVFLHTGSNIARVAHVLALIGWIVHRWQAYRTFHKYEKPLVESIAYVTLSCALLYPGGLTASPTVALTAFCFPIATILIERLEMSLHFRKIGARIMVWLLVAWCAIWIASAWFNVLSLTSLGVVTLLLASGCIRFDMSLWMKGNGAPIQNFLNRALTVAYGWLALLAISLIVSKILPGAALKDILFHLAGLGFIFTMILAHAPLILPAVIGKGLASSAPVFPFVLFQLWTAIRITSDFFVERSTAVWIWSGWITGVLHLITFIVYVALVMHSNSRT